jgi:hypothetical protein
MQGKGTGGGIFIKEGIDFSISTCAVFMERVFKDPELLPDP